MHTLHKDLMLRVLSLALLTRMLKETYSEGKKTLVD
jgi:hypothetical protein